MSVPVRFSYFFILAIFILIALLHLTTPLISALFAYFALSKLHVFKKHGRVWTVLLFVILLAGLIFALTSLINQAVRTLPIIASKAIPSILQWAGSYDIALPFTDYESLRFIAIDTFKHQAHHLGSFANYAHGASMQVIYFLAGIVVAINLFISPKFEIDDKVHPLGQNMYSQCCAELGKQFLSLYHSFARVMGAQILISALNTTLTSLFIISMKLPYAPVVVGLTFLFGLLPVIGNLISNTIIVGIGFTISPHVALICLVFLVTIHKLEYFVNGKIVGQRIRNPLWLTLLGLIIGERIMGIPGLMLAPIILNYLKVQASNHHVDEI